LDNDLVAFLDTIPAHFHWDCDETPVGNQYFQGKRLLRAALATLVPEKIAKRPKKGFSLPINEWFSGPLHSFVEAALDKNSARILEYLDPIAIDDAVAGAASGRDTSAAKLWSLLSVEMILSSFFN